MFARIGLRVGNMFGKPFQALLRRFAVQYAAEASANALYSFSEPSLPGAAGMWWRTPPFSPHTSSPLRLEMSGMAARLS